MNHPRSLRRIVCASAFCDVRRFEHVVAADAVFTDNSIAFDCVVVRAFEQHMREIVMQFAERDFEFFEFDSFEHRRDHGQLSRISTLNILRFSMTSQ